MRRVIALENPEMDKKWRDYIYINNLEGKHYRVSRANINAFWQAEKAGIQHDVAERPGSRQKLYDQLDKLL